MLILNIKVHQLHVFSKSVSPLRKIPKRKRYDGRENKTGISDWIQIYWRNSHLDTSVEDHWRNTWVNILVVCVLNYRFLPDFPAGPMPWSRYAKYAGDSAGGGGGFCPPTAHAWEPQIQRLRLLLHHTARKKGLHPPPLPPIGQREKGWKSFLISAISYEDIIFTCVRACVCVSCSLEIVHGEKRASLPHC